MNFFRKSKVRQSSVKVLDAKIFTILARSFSKTTAKACHFEIPETSISRQFATISNYFEATNSGSQQYSIEILFLIFPPAKNMNSRENSAWDIKGWPWKVPEETLARFSNKVASWRVIAAILKREERSGREIRRGKSGVWIRSSDGWQDFRGMRLAHGRPNMSRLLLFRSLLNGWAIETNEQSRTKDPGIE